jgi:hypothetical protein
MNQREKRQKAQEVFNEGNFVLGGKTTFENAFSQVEECVVEVEESGHGVSDRTRIGTYRNPGQFINCSNPLCYNGGFNIGLKIDKMVRNRETQREDSDFCQGNEGSPKGHRVYKKCWNSFKYKISIKYKT